MRNNTRKKQEYEDNWPLFERFLGYLRYLKIRKYVIEMKQPVCADIGCGFNGRFLFSIAKKIGRGYGFDLKANTIEKKNIKIVNNAGTGGYLPLKDETVDRVFLLAVLEHLDERAPIIGESFRILKKGGKIIITTPAPMSKPILEFLSYKLHLIRKESILEHKHYYNDKELKNLLKRFDCKCERYKKFQMGFNQLIIGEKNL